MGNEIEEVKKMVKSNCKEPIPKLPPGCPSLPLNTPDDLSIFNNFLTDETNFSSLVSS